MSDTDNALFQASDSFAKAVAADDDTVYAQVFTAALNIATRGVHVDPASRKAVLSRTLALKFCI